MSTPQDDNTPERSKHARKNPKSWRRPDGEGGTAFPIVVKRKNGGQSIYYRATKRITLGDERRVVSVQAKSAKEAEERLAVKIVRLRVEAGLDPLDALPAPALGVLTVEKCLWDWLEEKRPKLSLESQRMYEARIRRHIIPELGAQHVRTLTSSQLREFFEKTLPAKGLGVSSIRQTHIALKGALDYYLRDRIITAHPMVGLKAERPEPKSSADQKEIRRASKFLNEYLLVEARKIDEEARWFLGMLGIRQGEALGLTDDCLVTRGTGKDKTRRIVIKQQLQRITADHGCGVIAGTGKFSCGKSSTNCSNRKGTPGWVLKAPKSESGKREIVIPESAWEMLIAHRNKQRTRRLMEGFDPAPGPGLNHLLFTEPTGKPRYGQSDREQLTELLTNIQNLPTKKPMTVHTLRGVATTRLIEGKAAKEDLIAMMGWSRKNADAQIAIYSSADNAKLAAATTTAYVEGFYTPAATPPRASRKPAQKKVAAKDDADDA